MLNCKQATELISRETDERLPGKEAFDMRLHLMMCRGCRNFRSNVRFLRQACKSAAPPDRSGDPMPPGGSRQP
jgi:hypothetical protein